MENLQFNFGDLFGSQFALSEPKKEAKKEVKKEAKKETAKKSKKISLPCRVRSNGFDVTVEGDETIKDEELVSRLYEMGYTEVASSFRSLVVSEGNAFIVDSQKIPPSEETLIDFSNTVTFAFGMKKIEFTKEDFTEEEEVTVKDIYTKVIESMPEFSAATFAYDIESNTIVPNFNNRFNDSTKISLPAIVNVCGEDVTVDELSGDTAGDLIKQTFAEILNMVFVSLFEVQEGTYCVQFSSKASKDRIDASASLKKNKGKSAKQKEAKYMLPVNVFLAMNGHRETLTSEMFEGKEKVTAADITAYYSDKFMVFRSAEKVKGLTYTYDDIANIVTVDSTPGRRGATAPARFFNAGWDYEETERFVSRGPVKCITQIEEWIEYAYDTSKTVCNALIGEGLPYCGRYMFSNRVCNYFYQHDEASHVDTVEDVVLKIGKIPEQILSAVLAYFREDLSREAICRIEFDHNTKSYYVVLPKSYDATKTYVEKAVFSPPAQNCDVLCTIHSHNTMDAFWSRTDNAAERDEIGLFGVIGNLDTDNPTMKFRASYEGTFLDLPKGFIFE